MNRVLSSLVAAVIMVATMTAAPVPTTPKAPTLRSGKVIKAPGSNKSLQNEPRPYQVGIASWYGKQFHGRATASGEDFDMFELTAAHRQLPLGSFVKVTNLKNGKWIIVRVNDRGPYVSGRIMDLSYGAARMLSFRNGVERVRLDVIQPETLVLAVTADKP